MTQETKWLLSKLAKVLTKEYRGQTEIEIQVTESLDWDKILILAKQHAVLSLLDPLLEEEKECEKMPENIKYCIRQEARQIVQQNYHLLFLSRNIIEELEKEGISTALLKGASVAAFYPVPELRKSGDVDLFLFSREMVSQAEEVLFRLGILPHTGHSVNHHKAYITEENIEIEMHTLLAEPFDDAGVNEKMVQIQNKMQEFVQPKALMGISLPVLTEGVQAYHLLLHMLQHFLRAGFGLKLLCDWVVFWNQQNSEKEVETYLELVEESGLTYFSDMITAIGETYLGLLPDKAKRIRRHFVEKEDMKDFLEEILRSLEFGGVDVSRMVALRGTSILDLWREFHHQMHLNFPRAGKCVLFWPALWSITLWRFCRNNRKIRGTSAKQVIEEAKKRGKIAKKLHLFKIEK